METGAEFTNKKTQQLGIIKLINKELGIENSLLKVTMIREKIEALNDYLFTNTEMIHNVFGIRNRTKHPKSDFKSSISLLNKIYGEWMGVGFNANTKGKEKVIVSHTLQPKNELSQGLFCENIENLPYYKALIMEKTKPLETETETLEEDEDEEIIEYELIEEHDTVVCEVTENIKFNPTLEIVTAEPVIEKPECITVTAEPLNIVMEEMADLIFERLIKYSKENPPPVPIIYRKTRASVDMLGNIVQFPRFSCY